MTPFYLFSFIFGLCIGSFINAFVYRLREEMPFVNARSICPKCKTQLKWFHNIPLISFLFLNGKCHLCKEKISWQYPIVEFVVGALFFVSANLVGLQYANLFFQWFVITILAIIFLYDLKYSQIPDSISIPAIMVILIFQFVSWRVSFINTNYTLLAISAIIGGGWFAIQYFISRGRWVGDGDIRLGVLMGLILPWPQIITALALAYIGGTIVSLPLLLNHKKKLKSEIPFGVFLAPATIIALWWGEQILAWYLRLI